MAKIPVSVLLLALCTVVTGCSKSNNSDKINITQLNDLLQTKPHECNDVLRTVGNDLIGSKKHYLSFIEEPKLILEKDDEEETKLTKDSELLEKPTADVVTENKHEKPIRIMGTLIYNDRPSHIVFEAYQNKEEHSCVILYQLDYMLDVSCMEVREEVFKKWLHKANLGDKTRYYVHKRKPSHSAYLTNIDRNRKCLVRKRANSKVSVD